MVILLDFIPDNHEGECHLNGIISTSKRKIFFKQARADGRQPPFYFYFFLTDDSNFCSKT